MMDVLIMRSIIALSLFISVSFQHIDYNGYKVYRLYPSKIDQLNFLVKLRENKDLDFWSFIARSGNPTDVMVRPYKQLSFESMMNSKDIKYEVLIDNFKKILGNKRPRRTILSSKISFNKYLRHGEINHYLNQLERSYPNIISVETIGKSYEGRNINIIKISKHSGTKKPTIFIDAGIHAREWIAPMQAIYFINQLVQNPHLIDKINYHILPLVNPDGYEYSHTWDRLWRKTRSVGKFCYGVDGNRNFGFHWGESGSSRNQCDPTYMGPYAFSEVETRVVRNYVLKYKNDIKLYLTLHSYGNYILYPWGFTDVLPNNFNELQFLGNKVAQAIFKVRGTQYTVGSAANVIYEAAGGSDDWVRGVAGIDLSYTIELPGGGSQGFDLPESKILPILRETWVGLIVYHNYIVQKYVS